MNVSHGLVQAPLTLAVSTVALFCLVLSACGRGEESAVSHAATTAPRKAGPAVESHPRVETAFVELGSDAHDLSLAGKVAYGEDHFSRVSSPLQGRVLEVRAHLGEHVQAGSVLLVLDSQEIAQAYGNTPRKTRIYNMRHAPTSWPRTCMRIKLWR